MAQDLWKIRQRKGFSVKQLAARSGVSARALEAYEQGEPITVSHRARVAKVLFVNPSDIKIQSKPKPEPKPEPKPTPEPEAEPKPEPKPEPKAETETELKPKPAQPKAEPAPKPKPKPAPARPSSPPARPTQIAHLLQLAQNMGEDETAVTETVGKPLTELTQAEASQWLFEYTHKLQEYKEEQEAARPPGTRRKRAHLPEGVDEYELNYLQARQEAEDTVTFTLFDGTTFEGKIIGFSPYGITIHQEDGSETTLQKLALAYYTAAKEAA